MSQPDQAPAAPGQAEPPPAEAPAVSDGPTSAGHTYGQILKSSVLVGGSSVIGIAVRIVRTKVMAFLLGPAGFGLFGLYGAVEVLTESIAGVGVSSSGVRQIAEAVGTGDDRRIAKTAAVLQRTSVALGFVGALVLVALARPVSRLTFGSTAHAAAIRLLSLAVLVQITSTGQAALVQGMRRISDLARMSVIGTVAGTLCSIPVVYVLRESGVVPSLIVVNIMTLLPSWWFSRKIGIRAPTITTAEVVEEASALLKLGSIFMLGWQLLAAVAYLVRILILRKAGLEAAGLYQSAWTMGGLYVSIVIQAMAADFYPRLTANAKDNLLCNRLVNEQARVGMLMAGPGVLVTLTFTPLVMIFFYSAKFTAAAVVMRWISVGSLMQVITWPMGFILVAKNRRSLYFGCEIACAGFYAAASWLSISLWGLNGAGIAFFAYCLFHGLLHYPVVGRLSGFRWSRENYREGLFFLAAIAVVCASFWLLPQLAATAVGFVVVVASCIYSLRTLVRLVPLSRVPRPLRAVILALGFAPAHQGAD